jgi:hypothetical protein
MAEQPFIEYCFEHCTVGKAKSKELLATNNSAYDAAIDFNYFVEDCKKTCSYHHNWLLLRNKTLEEY